MKDSADLEIPRAYVADKILPPLERLKVFRSWTAIASLLPKGGDAVWGEEGSDMAPDTSSPYIVSVTSKKK